MNQIAHGGIQLVLILHDCAAVQAVRAEVIAILEILLVLLVCEHDCLQYPCIAFPRLYMRLEEGADWNPGISNAV